MYSRQTSASGSVKSENRPWSELADEIMLRIGGGEICICWNSSMWSKSDNSAMIQCPEHSIEGTECPLFKNRKCGRVQCLLSAQHQ
jgi:hypothetical protein